MGSRPLPAVLSGRKSDGTVWAWGGNSFGELGDGTTNGRVTPVQVHNLSGVTAVAADDFYSLAVKSDGTVWAWGSNHHGQLGDGTTDSRSTPVQVHNLSGVTAVDAGPSLALKGDCTVWAWGENRSGQLGDGTTDDRFTPVQVRNLSGVQAVAAGRFYGLASKNEGSVWIWGQEFGHSPPTFLTPVQVRDLTASAVAAGDNFGLAVGTRAPTLTIVKILKHPDENRFRLFDLQIDGDAVKKDVNSGSTGPQKLSLGDHSVGERGGTGTQVLHFGTVIGGDCAADGKVNLALGDNKTCTITNYDHYGGCSSGRICCEPGDGTKTASHRTAHRPV